MRASSLLRPGKCMDVRIASTITYYKGTPRNLGRVIVYLTS